MGIRNSIATIAESPFLLRNVDLHFKLIDWYNKSDSC